MVVAPNTHLKLFVLAVLVLTLVGIPWLNRHGDEQRERAEQREATALGKRRKKSQEKVDELVESAQKALEAHDVDTASDLLKEAREPDEVPTPEPAAEEPAAEPESEAGDDAVDDAEAADDEPCPTEPHALVATLHELGLDVTEDWHAVNDDGLYRATVGKRFGENEVSCVLESYVGWVLQRTTLEAEFNSWQNESEILGLFTRLATKLCDDSSPELVAAIEKQDSWQKGLWKLERVQTSGGHRLLLRRSDGFKAPDKDE